MDRDANRPTLSAPALWHRIRGAHLPVERDGRAFSAHLAERTGLGEHEAQALEREYRRFLYLAARTDARRAPSDLVRRAWEYHSEVDDGYAEEFCVYVLDRQVRVLSQRKDVDPAYAMTLNDYQDEFGEAPPPAFWPDPSPHHA